MQFSNLIVAALVGYVAAQGSICYDNFDCLLNGGGKCVKTGLLGKCSGKNPTSTTLGTVVTTGPAPTATGAVCFDDGDCIFKGGKCVKTGLLGKCAKKA